LFDLAELLAYHWECAGEPGRAVPHLLRAADKSASRFAGTEALDYLQRAARAAHAAQLTLAEADVHVRFNYIYRRQGDYAAARTHLSRRFLLPGLRTTAGGKSSPIGLLLRVRVLWGAASISSKPSDHRQLAIGTAKSLRSINWND
jgi:hypothetical protein